MARKNRKHGGSKDCIGLQNILTKNAREESNLEVNIYQI
jgi:hypothetical protein